MHNFRFLSFFILLYLVPAVAGGFPNPLRFSAKGMGEIVADFNGDGKLDVLGLFQCEAQPCSTGTITVALGLGNGQFRAPITTPISSFPLYAIGTPTTAVGDFNSDHKLDFAFVSSSLVGNTHAIEIAFGNGDGSFGQVTTLQLSGYWGTLLAGDLNGDGKLDLLGSGQSSSYLFLGNGDGTFVEVPAGQVSSGCTLVDVNHDGKLDLLGNEVQLGNGDGTFQPPTTGGLGYCPSVADFNGDGNLDVVSAMDRGFSLFLGNGDGTFQPPRTFTGYGPVYRITVTDFNGDRKPDLLFSINPSHGTILLNNGKGTFRSTSYLMASPPIVGDFNGDGRTDLISITNSYPYTNPIANVALARPNGTMPLPRSYYVPALGAGSLAVNDINGDGLLDLIILFRNREGGDLEGAWGFLYGQAGGTFRPGIPLLAGTPYSNSAFVSDLNGDGVADLLAAGGGSVSARIRVPGSDFQNVVESPIHGVSHAALADFNGDGIPDLAVDSVSGWPYAGAICLGKGDGSFRIFTALPRGIQAITAADFNKDGKQDLVISTSASAGVLLGNGDGTFRDMTVLRNAPAQYLVTGDFNSDGNLDIALVSASSWGPTTLGPTIMGLYAGKGDGSFYLASRNWVKADVTPGGAVAADFNRDGNLDLAVSLSSSEIAILLGNGGGGFNTRSLYFGGAYGLLAADLDGNGTPDVAVITSDSTVAVLSNAP